MGGLTNLTTGRTRACYVRALFVLGKHGGEHENRMGLECRGRHTHGVHWTRRVGFLLNLNPGYSGSEGALHRNRVFREICLRNLLHRNSPISQFYYFHPKLKKSGGYIWWARKLSELLKRFGADTIGTNLFVLEYFPYHSKSFKGAPRHFRSQAQLYNAQLLREAMKRKADIVIMRGKSDWVELVSELQNYPYLHGLKSPQAGSLSRKNLGRKSFQRIVKRLEKNARPRL